MNVFSLLNITITLVPLHVNVNTLAKSDLNINVIIHILRFNILNIFPFKIVSIFFLFERNGVNTTMTFICKATKRSL